jgi:hypothetical protein
LTTLVDIATDGRARRIQSWAGSPDSGTLLESWELVSDETMPAERVPAAVFDPTPPDALLRWVFKENISDRPIPHSVTITQALELAQTPLFELRPVLADLGTVEITTTGELTPAELGTVGITTTGELTPTEALLGAPPLLHSIFAGAPAEDPQPLAYSFEANVFERALKDGYAIRFGYIITAADGSTQNPNLYQGSAEVFGAYLRASAVWKSSSAETFQIGGKPVSGWRVIERQNDSEWLLFELDGTLIAAQSPSDELLAALAQLQQVTSDK